MADVYLYGEPVSTLFELLPSLGSNEDDMSRAVAWLLGRCPALLKEFIHEFARERIDVQGAKVRLQHIESQTGRTDVEVQIGHQIHIVIEAKRGWNLPSDTQLTQYAKRLRNSDAKTRAIVVLTDCSEDYVSTTVTRNEVLRIPVKHMSWAEFCQTASDSRPKCTPAQRQLINDALLFLKELITMQQADSNWVYVLALSGERPKGWKTNWIDVVRVQKRYFHPFGGNGWPTTPPNYIAFRYGSELQSIHHIEGYDIVDDVHYVIPEIPKREITGKAYIVYKLGPGFRPDHTVPTGSIFRGARRSCMLDTLFTSKTIEDACRISAKRQNAAPEFAER